MNKYNSKEFSEFIRENKVVSLHENPIELNSGQLTNIYVNWRDVCNDVYLINKLSGYVLDFTEDLKLDFNCFYGVPEGMSKLGIISQLKKAISNGKLEPGYILPMGRGKEKTHGREEDRQFIGQPKGRIVILEDVVTTGCSMLKEIWNINGNDAQVIAAIALTDRMVSSDENSFKTELQALRVNYYSLSNLCELEKSL